MKLVLWESSVLITLKLEKKSKGSSGHIKITVCLIHRANSFEKLEITSA